MLDDLGVIRAALPGLGLVVSQKGQVVAVAVQPAP